MACAFEVTPGDIENVLRNNKEILRTTNGMPLDAFAELLMDEIDHDRIERAALDSGDDLDVQTEGAYSEIKEILIEDGVLAKVTLH